MLIPQSFIMKKILILRGLPASGKSTYARKLLAENPNAWKRLNKDELRAMLDDSAHTPANEQFVNRVRDMLLMEALRARKNVIIDDTNLTDKPIEQITQVAKKYTEQSGIQVHIEIK